MCFDMGIYEKIIETIEKYNKKIEAIKEVNDILDGIAFRVNENGNSILTEKEVGLLRLHGIKVVTIKGKYELFEAF
jgi:hypothetical protein